MQRYRLLAVRGRARKALTDGGLFKDRVFAKVRSVDSLEPGVELLDGRTDVPGPMYSEAELTVLRTRELEMRSSGG
jgi:hypothetical protein